MPVDHSGGVIVRRTSRLESASLLRLALGLDWVIVARRLSGQRNLHSQVLCLVILGVAILSDVVLFKGIAAV